MSLHVPTPIVTESKRLGRIDYDLHGFVGLRLLDASLADARAVARQVGPLRRLLDREPDITIRFVDQLRLTSPLRYLGGDAGFTDDAFLVLRSKHHARARVRIPFDRVGGPCEIVCESGLPAVPLLIPVINLTALGRGLAPLHASAFVHDGKGVLATGWSKGGKTEALLAFMSRGATYVGDEWIYLDPGAKRMYGIPQPIRLWDWHLEQYASYQDRLGRRQRLKLGMIRAASAMGRAQRSDKASRRSPVPGLERLRGLIRSQAFVDVEPEELFGPCATLDAGIDRVVLLASAEDHDITVEAITGTEVVDRMVHSVDHEFRPFLSYYDMFRFAFPECTNEHVEGMKARLSDALHRALDDRPSFMVRHPYPMKIASLYDAMRPCI